MKACANRSVPPARKFGRSSSCNWFSNQYRLSNQQGWMPSCCRP